MIINPYLLSCVPPSNTSVPVITGTASIGNMLSGSDGSWTPTPSSYTYQWRRDGVNIPGATANTYTLVEADAGNDITFAVSGSNGTCASTAVSAATSIDWPSSASIGTLFSDAFNRATPGSNYINNTSDVTFSQNSTFLRAARTNTGSFAQFIQLIFPESGQGMLSESMTATLRFRIVTSSVGVSIGWKSLAGNSVVDMHGLMITGTSGSGRIYHNGSQVATTAATLNTTAGDTCEVEFTRLINTFTVTARKINGTPAERTVDYTLSTTGAPLAPSVSQINICFNGGTYDLESFSLVQGLTKYPRVAFVGDSITQWYYASTYSNRFANKAMSGSAYPYIVLAGQGQRTEEILKTVTEIISIRPRYAIVMIGTNDIGTGVADATWQANYTSYIDQILAAGIRVVLLYLIPRNTYDFRPSTVGSPNKWIADTYASNPRVTLIDTYTGLKDPSGNGIDATYSTDGVHPNNAGTTVISNRIRSDIPTILGI